MANIKDILLRKFGDDGAETLKRYMVQIDYTSYWCIRMLRSGEDIAAVIPEFVDDLVVIRKNCHELHQVKTRQESRGPWTFGEVLPILCLQYSKRDTFANCHFYFVSNQIADQREQKKYGGSLFRLKMLLDMKHEKQIYNTKEQKDISTYESKLAPLIQEIMLEEYGETIDTSTAINLLHRTHIVTASINLYNHNNIEELEAALDALYPGQVPLSYYQLKEIHTNVVNMVLKKITSTVTMEERKICIDDMLMCRSKMVNVVIGKHLDFNTLPGRTLFDKKMLLGGFDQTELPRFYKQKASASYFLRSCLEIGMEDNVRALIDELLECQGECRDIVCRLNGMNKGPGPRILAMVKTKIIEILPIRSFPGQEITVSLCLGIFWNETNDCNAYWHGLGDSA